MQTYHKSTGFIRLQKKMLYLFFFGLYACGSVHDSPSEENTGLILNFSSGEESEALSSSIGESSANVQGDNDEPLLVLPETISDQVDNDEPLLVLPDGLDGEDTNTGDIDNDEPLLDDFDGNSGGDSSGSGNEEPLPDLGQEDDNDDNAEPLPDVDLPDEGLNSTAKECKKYMGAGTQGLHVAKSQQIIHLDVNSPLSIKITGNQNKIIANIAEGEELAGLCIFLAGSQAKIDLTISGQVEHLAIIARGNRAQAHASFAAGSVIEEISVDMKGNKPLFSFHGPGAFSCPNSVRGEIQCFAN